MRDSWWTGLLPKTLRKHVEGRPTLQGIIDNAGWLFGDKIVRLGVGLFVNVWVARYLGPEGFGTFNYAVAFISIVGALAALGLDSIVIRDIVRDPQAKDEILGSATLLKLIAGALTLVVVSGASGWLRPDDSTGQWLIIVLALGMLCQSLDTVDFWFQSQVKARLVVYARNAAFAVAALTKVLLILGQAPLIAFAWVATGELLLAAVGLAVMYRRDGNRLSTWSFRLSRARHLLTESWPLIIQGVVIMIYMRIDQVMLGQLASDKSVGIFSAAVRLVEIWYFIPVALTASLFPEIVNSKSLAPEKYQQRIQHLYDLMIWMAIGAALVTTLVAPLLVVIVFGEEYRPSATILTIQVWMAAAVFFGVARQKWLMVEGYLRDGLYVEIAGVLFNVSANFWLIPRYGAVGAAMASLITAFAANLAAAIISRPIRISLVMYGRSLLLPIRFCRRISGAAG
ncbi:MAG: flippase [Desulfuromonadales bacterium]|nr:flippase [Desulfuromonadales bacterium]